MDGKSLLRALIGVGLASWLQQPALADADQDDPTFLSGAELADRLLHNVVLIRTKENLKGAGFVVGGDGDWIHIATALHTLRSSDDEDKAGDFSESIRIRFCAEDGFSIHEITPANIYFVDEQLDLAAFRLPTPKDYAPVQRALSETRPAGGAQIWSIGKEGDCKIGNTQGAVDEPENSYGDITIDIAGAYGGTSGSPVITDRGIVGLVWSSANSVKVLARSIQSVRDRITSNSAAKWTLSPANNLPAGTREAANWELTKSLNDYVFTAKDMRDAFVKKSYHRALLGPVVEHYNAAIKAFNEVKDRHDGTLEREWGHAAREEYSAIRARIASVHARMLAFNADMEALRRSGNRIPIAIRRQMLGISPDIDEVDRAAQRFVRILKAERTP